MQAVLDTPIEYLKGVGPQRGEVLRKELGIATYRDLLFHFPYRHVDRTLFHRAADIAEDSGAVQLRGVLRRIQVQGLKQAKRLTARLEDTSGTVELVWFKGIRWVQPTLQEGATYVVYGKPTRFRDHFNIAHPDIEAIAQWEKHPAGHLQPVYSSTEKAVARGLNSKGIARLVEALLPQVQSSLPETLSAELVEQLGGMDRAKAVFTVHRPSDQRGLDMAMQRLKFEELFYVQLRLLRQKQLMQQDVRGAVFDKVGTLFNGFYKDHLPFTLTGAQMRVVKEIRKDMGSGHQMNRLVQGDVGSGKTLVALLSMLIALDNGFQAALMAPTAILAQQHYIGISKLVEGLPITVSLLTGTTKAAQRKTMLTALRSGHVHILVGTHALLEDRVVFERLGLVVIDEQHRFGVAQRARLQAKSTPPPHVLVMTATPIPRTLAMTLYGDLDVSVIDELPPGRKPIKTVHRTDASRNAVFGFIESELALGRQAYIVYPLIEETDPAKGGNTADLKDLMDGYDSITRRFPLPQYAVGIVHGRMDPEAKDYEMARFKKGETSILVSTTVIEVGVDVPNASVMVIENAERFGLSQLHQLRGRVGRGADASYCILMTAERLGNDARSRIRTMVSTQDGFVISEADLRLRGPGDLMGTQQSGVPALLLADLVHDAELLQAARRSAQRLLDADPQLQAPANAPIAAALHQQLAGRTIWGRIA